MSPTSGDSTSSRRVLIHGLRIPRRDFELHATIYRPEDAELGKTGFVFCTAFGEEGECTLRPFHELAVGLAHSGTPVMVPDLSGCGNSSGDMRDVTLYDWVCDIKRAAREVLRLAGVEHLGLLGLRLGAALSMVALPELPAVNAMVLWDPLERPEVHFHSVLRRRLVRTALTPGMIQKTRSEIQNEGLRRGFVDFDGYPVSRTLIEQLRCLTWDSMPMDDRQPLRVALACIGRRRRSAALRDLVSGRVPRADVDILLDEAITPFWTRTGARSPARLIRATEAWIRRLRMASPAVLPSDQDSDGE